MDKECRLTFKITFKPQWVLSKRGEKLPADRIMEELQKRFEIADASKVMTGCSGCLIFDQEVEESDIASKLTEVVKSIYGDLGDDEISVNIGEVQIVDKTDIPKPPAEDDKKEDAAPQETAGTEQPQQPQAQPQSTSPYAGLFGGSAPAQPAQPAQPKEPAMDRINALVGADDFKKLCAEVAAVAPGLKELDIVDSFLSRHYLIAVNDGCGLTTYLELFSDLVEELGLMQTSAQAFAGQPPKKVSEVRIKYEAGTNPAQAFGSALGNLTGTGKVVSIDISEWMSMVNDPDFRNFLRGVSANAGKNIVFFRVPFIEPTILRDIHNALNDLVFVTDIQVLPFAMEDLDKVVDNLLGAKGFTIDEEAREVLHTRIIEEKSDGRFYGVDTVNKVVLEMLYRKQLSNASSGENTKQITRDDIIDLALNARDNELTGMQMLDELVGIDPIKNRLLEMIAQIEASLQNDKLSTPCIHMRFVGRPGTGKTTIARILGKMLAEKGILRNGSFFEHSGRDLVGMYVGHTAPKTAQICRDAYGSVLFIDEAYTLYRDTGPRDNDFGKEAIATLIAEMENHRSDMVVIMAGYPDEMEELMGGNPGLRDRMPYVLEFPNYSREQLAEIFLSLCRKTFTIDEDFENAAREYFAKLSDEVYEDKYFSNARYARNLYERTWGKAVMRAQLDHADPSILTVEDFALATGDNEFSKILDKKSKPQRIGFK